MKELKYNLKYIFSKKELYFSIFIIFLINIIHCFMTIQYISSRNLLLENTYSAEYQFILHNKMVTFDAIIIIIFPIISSMIISDSDWIDKNNKSINILFTRINNTKNSIVRLILSFFVPFFICFCGFMLNYIIMSLVFKHGTLATFTQSVGFYQNIEPSYFMDNLRYTNPYLFVFIITIVTSITIGLLSSLSYSLSYFLKKRIFIYFVPLFIIILSEMILPLLKLDRFSVVKFLQPISKFTLLNFISFVIFIILVQAIIEIIKKIKKDCII